MPNEIQPIDVHVHIIGNGLSGSGCWLRLGGFNRILSRMILSEFGIDPILLTRNSGQYTLDDVYAERLHQYLSESSLKSAIVLAHEEVYDENGKRLEKLGTMYVPNDYVLLLCKKYPNFLPAVSIHPARPDAIDELERCAALGAVIMKCLPNCQNIDCSNPKYKPFWQKMAALRMPLLAHTGGEFSVQVVNRRYEDPELLRLPLECGVTIIAAHAASRSFPVGKDYFQVFREMLYKYSNLYGDVSALCTPFRSYCLKQCLSPEFAGRIVQGSDIPIPVSAFWPFVRGLYGFSEFRRLAAIKNPLERDYQIKKAIGFSEDIFSRAAKLIRLPDESVGLVS